MKPWFDRKFEPLNSNLSYFGTLERLRGTPLRLTDLLSRIPADLHQQRIAGTWSIQENAGHLLDLEPLWYGRIEDFIEGQEVLRAADLTNTKAHEAGHHQRDFTAILEDFLTARENLIATIEGSREALRSRTALHPRLKTPMLPVDLMYFIAEHDDHHLARMRQIWRLLGGSSRS